MPIEDRRDEMVPSDLGGQDTSTGGEVEIVEAISWWRKFVNWWRGTKQPTLSLNTTGFEQQRQEAINQAADQAIAEACNESEAQRKIRSEGTS